MVDLVFGTLNLAGSCISFVVGTSFKLVVLAGVAGAVLCHKKPDEKSFEKFIENEIKKNAPNPIAGKIVGKVVNKVSTTAFTDIIIARRADLKFPDGSEKRYLGVMGTWFDISSSDKTKGSHVIVH